MQSHKRQTTNIQVVEPTLLSCPYLMVSPDLVINKLIRKMIVTGVIMC